MQDDEKIQRLLVAQQAKLAGVTGLLLAGIDGRPVAFALEEGAARSTAAVSASSIQLARRLADLLGDGALEEMTVRTTDGYIILNSIGTSWVLTALTVRSANIAMINLAFRDLAPQLEELEQSYLISH